MRRAHGRSRLLLPCLLSASVLPLVRVATRSPDPEGDGGWTEKVVQCGDNRVDFSL